MNVINVCMNVINVCMNVINLCMNVCLYVRMYVCNHGMFVWMCVFLGTYACMNTICWATSVAHMSMEIAGLLAIVDQHRQLRGEPWQK